MSHVRALSRETSAGGPGSGLEHSASFLRAMYGQDFGLLSRSEDNHPPFRFADTKELDRVEPPAIANRARVLRSRELRPLFMAAWPGPSTHSSAGTRATGSLGTSATGRIIYCAISASGATR